MTIALRSEEMLGLVDIEAGTVDRRIFTDQEIYDLEMERIRRLPSCWTIWLKLAGSRVGA